MKLLFIRIKNSLPYFILISIYFLFINIEARRTININTDNKKEESLNKIDSNNINQRIAIPVIPYSHN